MKKISYIFSFFALTFCIQAQDQIIMMTGEQKQAVVKKVGVNTIEFVRYDNQSGALYEINKSDVQKIIYQNGVEEVIQPRLDETTNGNWQSAVKKEFVDSRDGRTYHYVEIGKQCWFSENLEFAAMAVNLNNDCNECCYMYNFENASKACPEGWHLPSDQEWMDLEIYYGMYEDEATETGWRGNSPGQAPPLLRDGKSGLDLHLCGYARFQFDDQQRIFIKHDGFQQGGYYWTGTEKNKKQAYYRNFEGRRSIYRDSENKDSMMSVRCIKD